MAHFFATMFREGANMSMLEWFIGDLHIKKLKRQDTYSVRVRLTDADGN